MGTGQDTGDCEAERWGPQAPPSQIPTSSHAKGRLQLWACPTLAPCYPGTRAATQGCAGAMPPSAPTSKPQPPWLGEGTSLPCVAPLLITAVTVPILRPSYVCGDHSSAGGGWQGPRQQRGTDPGPLQRGLGAVSLQGIPGAGTLHPSTCGTPKPPAAHQELLPLLTGHPKSV